MTPRQLQLLRNLHLRASLAGADELVRLPAGELLELINVAWQESRRADVAEAQLPERSPNEKADAAERRMQALGL